MDNTKFVFTMLGKIPFLDVSNIASTAFFFPPPVVPVVSPACPIKSIDKSLWSVSARNAENLPFFQDVSHTGHGNSRLQELGLVC